MPSTSYADRWKCQCLKRWESMLSIQVANILSRLGRPAWKSSDFLGAFAVKSSRRAAIRMIMIGYSWSINGEKTFLSFNVAHASSLPRWHSRKRFWHLHCAETGVPIAIAEGKCDCIARHQDSGLFGVGMVKFCTVPYFHSKERIAFWFNESLSFGGCQSLRVSCNSCWAGDGAKV